MGIDIGGSHISLGFVDDRNNLIDCERFNIDETWTPQDAINRICESVDILSKIVNELYSKWSLVAAGIGSPGQTKNGILVSAANLPNFKNTPLSLMLSNRLRNIPVLLLNDADASFHAELKSSKNICKYQNVQNACMISIGTGIGVSLYLNGTIYQGCQGLIESGHMIIDFSPQARQCGCGQVYRFIFPQYYCGPLIKPYLSF